MTMQEDIMSSEEEEEIPTLVPIVGTKRKIQAEDATSAGEDSQEVRKKLLKFTKKVKAPTSEELSQLRETENLFHSNMFRLQIEEMLKEVKPKESTLKKAVEWSKTVSEFLTNLESDETVYSLAQDAWTRDLGVRVPLTCDIPADPKTSFQFLSPAAVTLVGSVPAGCGFRPGLTLDLAVEMPKRMLHTGDHLNERYWRKKLAYLTVLASKLDAARSRLSIQCVEYRTTSSPALYSLSLLVTPAPSIGCKAKINIIAVPAQKAIKLSRCLPQACNIRSQWHHSAARSDQNEEVAEAETPMYNTLLARDVSVRENDEYRRRCYELGGNAMRDAYLLLCVWLQQRQLCQGIGSLSRFTLSLYLCRLLTSKQLHASMSSYQMLRNVWVRLGSAEEDWTGGDCFPVVLMDASGLHNLTAGMTQEFYRLLKEEARLALACLDDINLDSFRLLFMTPTPFLRQFDHYMCFNKREKLEAVVLKQDAGKSSCLDRGQAYVARFANLLVKFLKETLGERLSAVTYRTFPTEVCTAVGALHEEGEGSCLIVGIRLNSESCFKLIHRGPEANLPEAAAFREVWGPKAELRRFKDGQVCEASVWTGQGENPDSWAVRRVVTREMIGYLVARHWGLERQSGDYEYLADQMDCVVNTLERAAGAGGAGGNKKKESECATSGMGSEEVTVAVLNVWDTLARLLRDMTALPLAICSVTPTAEVLRYADPQAPVPCYQQGPRLSLDGPLPALVKPIEGVIEVTASGKWPEDVTAIARLKAAFYIELSDRLEKDHHILSQVNPHHVDVYQGGYVFRLRLFCAPEVTLLKKQIQDGVVRYKNSGESVALQQQLVHLPLLHSALHGLHQAQPVLGPGLCLAKRWLACQLLLGRDYWPQAAVELLGASLLVSGPAGVEPTIISCPQVFLLRFLALLATHNFLTDPVLVNVNGELSRNDILHIEARLRNDRGTLPPLVLLTPWDPSAQLWTRRAPNLATLVRTVALARASLHLAETNLVRGLSVQPIFQFPRSDFDVVISLNRSGVSKLPRAVATGDAGQRVQHLPVVNFNPVDIYVNLLHESYGDLALFMYDVYGGLEIGVVMKPDSLLEDNKETKLKCKRPADRSDGQLSLVLNRQAMLEDFYILGRGLVKAVTCKTTGLVQSPFRTLLV